MTLHRASLRRRTVLLLPAALSLPAARSGQAAGVALTVPQSLVQALDLALRAQRPLVVMVSLEGCPFCRVVRDHYLGPLVREEGQPVVQVDMGSGQPLRDVAGVLSTQDQVIRAWKVTVAPTLLFIGPGGREVAPRLVGASIPDFYGGYLDERLRVARANLKISH